MKARRRAHHASPTNPVPSRITEAGSGFSRSTTVEGAPTPDTTTALLVKIGVAAPADGKGLKMLVLLEVSGTLAPASGNGLRTVPVVVGEVLIKTVAPADDGAVAVAAFGKKAALPDPEVVSVTIPLPGNVNGAGRPLVEMD